MKTIRLNSQDYRLTPAGAVEVFGARHTEYQPDYEAADFRAELEKTEVWDWWPTRYAVGTQAVLVSRTDVSPDAIRRGTRPKFYLHFDLDGVPGNSDRSIKRTTGWRGTTNDVSVDAHGVVTIRKIRELKSGDIAVTVS